MNGATIFGKAALIGETTNKGARDKRNDDRSAAFTGPNGGGQEVQYLVVADGVTSTHGGDQASEIAVRTLRQVLQAPSARLLTSRMAEAIHQANQAIADVAAQNPDLKGMSTTLVLAAIEGEKLYVMHLGDSRAYLLRGGKAYQLTLDHTWVQEALDEGRITPEQAATHPNRHVIQRYLGAPRTMSIDTRIIEPGTEASAAERRATEVLPLQPGDAVLLCSDGLYGRINSAELAAGVAAHRGQPQRAADALVNLALKRDEPDNITALLLTTDGGPAAAAAPFSRLATIGIAVVLGLLALGAFFLLRPAGETPATPAPAVAAPGVDAAAAATPVEVAQAGDPPTTDAAPTVAETTVEATADTAAVPAAETDPAPASAASAVTDTLASGAAEASPLPATATGTLAPTSTATGGEATDAAIAGSAVQTATADARLAEGAAGITSALEVTATDSITGMDGITDASGTTAAPSLLATATPASSTAASGPGTATVKPTSTRIATSTPVPSPTATATPSPTATRPTATPRPTPIPAAEPPAGSGAAASAGIANNANSAGGPTSVVILGPPDGTNTNSTTTFSWQPNTPLEEGQVFEVVFWQQGEGPGDGKAWTNAAATTQMAISPGDRAGSYRWGVWLGTSDAGQYQRLRYLGQGYTFDVPNSGRSDGGNNGNTPPSGGGDDDEKG